MYYGLRSTLYVFELEWKFLKQKFKPFHIICYSLYRFVIVEL